MTERFRRVNYGRLPLDLTIDDPKVYAKPWTVTRRLADRYETSLPAARKIGIAVSPPA